MVDKGEEGGKVTVMYVQEKYAWYCTSKVRECYEERTVHSVKWYCEVRNNFNVRVRMKLDYRDLRRK